jgi:hypothetical protein
MAYKRTESKSNTAISEESILAILKEEIKEGEIYLLFLFFLQQPFYHLWPT